MTKATLWRHWTTKMRTTSPTDMATARAWFEELYGAGRRGVAIPTHCGAPLSYDEAQVYTLGRTQARE